jgi:hypothetical protein
LQSTPDFNRDRDLPFTRKNCFHAEKSKTNSQGNQVCIRLPPLLHPFSPLNQRIPHEQTLWARERTPRARKSSAV